MQERLVRDEHWGLEVKLERVGAEEVPAIGRRKVVTFGMTRIDADMPEHMPRVILATTVQRVPQTETSGRIHTSAITVAVLPEAEEVDVQVDPKDLRVDYFCSSGPGGQSVNTTYSAVRLTHLPTNVVVSMQDEKSQIKNKEKAMRILRARLQELEEQRQHDLEASERKSMVGSGDRSEKIRTYNFKENRVTDHRIGMTVHQLDLVMEGQIDDFIAALQTHYQTEKLKAEAVAA